MAESESPAKLTGPVGIAKDVLVSVLLICGAALVNFLKARAFPDGMPWSVALMLNLSELTLVCAFLFQFIVMLEKLGVRIARPAKAILSFMRTLTPNAPMPRMTVVSTGKAPNGNAASASSPRQIAVLLFAGLVGTLVLLAVVGIVAGLGMLPGALLLAVGSFAAGAATVLAAIVAIERFLGSMSPPKDELPIPPDFLDGAYDGGIHGMKAGAMAVGILALLESRQAIFAIIAQNFLLPILGAVILVSLLAGVLHPWLVMVLHFLLFRGTVVSA